MSVVPSISVVIPSSGDATSAISLANQLALQVLSTGGQCQVLIVAQGWKGKPQAIKNAQVIEVARPVGRARARNMGAARVDGEILLFLDADCRPASHEHASELLAAFENPAVVAVGGSVQGTGTGFWERYQRDADARRVASSTACGPALTAANLAVRRSAFEQCGGFDESYVGYGFEDRDLLLRLSSLGKVTRIDRATVIHEDRLELGQVAAKLQEAGGHSSMRFAINHPAEYRTLGYAAFDTRVHPWLRPAKLLFRPTLRAARFLEPLFDKGWMPYPLAKTLVKVTCALAFLYGTTRTQDPSSSA